MKKLLTPLLVISLFAACISEKQKLVNAIDAKEKELMADSLKSIDTKKAKEMIELYKSYAEKYATDTMSYEYLFKAADISNGIGEYKNAIELYKNVSAKRDFRKKAVALFLQGFIYENQLKDYFQARKIYEEFLKEYPDHALTDDVNYSLQNLGKSPEELIREFEQQQAAKDTLATK